MWEPYGFLQCRHSWHIVPSHKVSWVSNDRHPTSNQMNHLAINKGFRSYLLDVRNKGSADVVLERFHHLMMAYIRLGVAATTSLRVGELQRLSSKSAACMTQLSFNNERTIFLIGYQTQKVSCRRVWMSIGGHQQCSFTRCYTYRWSRPESA